MTIKKALDLAYKEITCLDARILLTYVLKKDLSFLFTNLDFKLEEKDKILFFSLVNKRKEGFCIAYLTFSKEFYNYDFYVDQRVLVPRCDTEVLVEKALSLVKENDKVLDLCCGSGIIGLTLKKERPSLDVVLSDISFDALEVCKINKKRLNVDCSIIQSDLFENIKETFSLIVTNPPYVEPSFLENCQIELTKEPLIALSGISSDGLLIINNIIINAKKHLNGMLIIEASDHQIPVIINTLKENGYENIGFEYDLSNQRRICFGQYLRENNN